MIRLLIFLTLSGMLSLNGIAQSGTEVYILDLTFQDGQYMVSNPRSISQDNPGYDNQPSFGPEGKYLYYVATRNDQTDIVRVDLATNERKWISKTPDGGEYSPVLSPDGRFISAVQLEKNGGQLLWQYQENSDKKEVLIKGAKIGYYCWIDQDMLAAFVLGEPNLLRLFDLKDNTSKFIAENIGRSLHLIPGKNRVSYISKSEADWYIMSFNPKNGKTKRITCSLTGSEDMAWTAESMILMGKGGKLYFKNPKKGRKWKEIESFTSLKMNNVTRLAVSRDGKKLAVVVDENKAPQ